MRRARTPEICRTDSRATSASSATVQRSFCSEASGLYAARKRPGTYSTSRTRPAAGARFTWTSRGERKIERRTARPTQRSSTSAMPMTLPSAGASTAPGSAGAVRSGSRKNARNASATAARIPATTGHPIQARIHAATAGGKMNGNPSAATGMRTATAPPRPSLLPRGLDPGHHLPQPGPDLLDRMLGIPLPHGEEAGAVGLVLQDPLPRELTRLDLGEDLLHLRLDPIVHDARPPGVVAVLRGVGDRVPHVGQAPLVEEVHDQLHLVHALEVGDLGLIARLHQGLEGVLDEVGDAPAQRGLLAEEVGLRLLLEGGLDDAGARAAHALAVGQREVLGLARHVLVHRHQGGHAGSLGEEVAHHVAG